MRDEKVCWYEAEEDDSETGRLRAQHLVAETAEIETRQQQWHDLALWNATLYSNRVLPGFNWGMEDHTGQELIPANMVTENLIKSIGDTMVAKASSSPIKPTPVPRGASYKTNRLVKKLDRWASGTWRQLQSENAAIMAFLDAYICGIGCVRVDHDRDGLVLESVFFDNIIVDNRECANRTPPQTYRVRQLVDHEIVEARYGVDLDDEEVKKEYVDHRAKGDGKVVVVEAWRLPDADGTPGRHVVACCGQLLVDEEWVHKVCPLVFFHWDDRTSGFYGPSGIETLVPYQIRLNELNDIIREAQDLTARPRLLVHAGSRVDHQSFDNLVGRVISYTGIKPEAFTWQTAIAELYAERDRIQEQAYNFYGVSKMSSQAALPPSVRLDSSAGVKEFRAMEDTRFLRMWTRFEDFRLEIARRQVDAMTWVEGRDHRTTWHSGGKAKTEVISWKDVAELQKDHYSWSLEALPLSAMSPGARKDTVESWLRDGRISLEEARNMVGHPDLERQEDLVNASIDDIKRVIELLEDGMYEAPDPTQNLAWGLPAVINNMHLLRQYEDVDAEVIEAHLMWIRSAQGILSVGAEGLAPPPPEGAMMPDMAPQMDPMTGLPMAPQEYIQPKFQAPPVQSTATPLKSII